MERLQDDNKEEVMNEMAADFKNIPAKKKKVVNKKSKTNPTKKTKKTVSKLVSPDI